MKLTYPNSTLASLANQSGVYWTRRYLNFEFLVVSTWACGVGYEKVGDDGFRSEMSFVTRP